MLKKRYLVPIVSILFLIVITGVVFAGAISNLWTSPNLIVTTPGGGGAPSSIPLVVSSPDFVADRNISTGAATFASVTLTNPSPSGALEYTGVLVNFVIHKTGTPVIVSDINLYYSIDAGVNWITLPLVLDAGVLTGSFGPVGGFPVGFGYNVTTPLKAVFNTSGTYWVTAQAIQ